MPAIAFPSPFPFFSSPLFQCGGSWDRRNGRRTGRGEGLSLTILAAAPSMRTGLPSLPFLSLFFFSPFSFLSSPATPRLTKRSTRLRSGGQCPFAARFCYRNLSPPLSFLLPTTWQTAKGCRCPLAQDGKGIPKKLPPLPPFSSFSSWPPRRWPWSCVCRTASSSPARASPWGDSFSLPFFFPFSFSFFLTWKEM